MNKDIWNSLSFRRMSFITHSLELRPFTSSRNVLPLRSFVLSQLQTYLPHLSRALVQHSGAILQGFLFSEKKKSVLLKFILSGRV